MKKIYYAHHMWKYGTELENYELDLISKELGPGYKIFNPSTELPQGSPSDVIMKMCFDTIKDCDAMVFSSVNGVVGRGVVAEVELAKKLKQPVYYIHNNKLKKCNPTFTKTNQSGRVYATVNMGRERTFGK